MSALLYSWALLVGHSEPDFPRLLRLVLAIIQADRSTVGGFGYFGDAVPIRTDLQGIAFVDHLSHEVGDATRDFVKLIVVQDWCPTSNAVL
ncbi:hypothetical protein [Pseudomonas synxantha]|uniref:Uncharacterized protein n=1 Tax=Pseudomonas synxantha TaxID=47883 RepID=A0ACC6JRQ5_9PSED|nr:hypothetical protein [Pseudomonas synxantha]MDR6609073.1 hypothetical protein [Pseudomonas synxantha]